MFVQNIEGIAGSEKYFWQLLPALKKGGVDVSFLCVYKKEFTEISQTFCNKLIQENIPVHRIETKSYLSLGLLRRIKKLLKSHNFQIIHSHLIYADFWSAMLRTFFRVRTVTVSTLHGYQENIYTEYCLDARKIPKNKYYRVAKFTYKRIDFVYSCSHGLKQFFSQAGIEFKNPVEVIHHGFDYPEIISGKHNPDEFVCAIPGRLIPRKGHQLVLKNCKYLFENIPGFKLVIIGDGPLRKELEDYVSANNLNSCVVFTGNVPDVRPVLSETDLVLIPSYAEGLPLVIFEAMSVVKPVIAFDTIGPSEVIIDGVTGYLVKPFDEIAFAEKIIEISRNRKQLVAMGVEGKKRVESEFSLHKMTVETANFYQTCLNSRPFLIM